MSVGRERQSEVLKGNGSEVMATGASGAYPIPLKVSVGVLSFCGLGVREQRRHGVWFSSS